MDEFLRVFQILMASLYFQCNKEFFQQINGLPMGLFVSPIIADIVIFYFFYFFTVKSRYVDQSFIIIAKNKLKLLLKFVNNYHPRLKFTHETENNNSINFLDVLVIENEDYTVFIDLY